MHQCYKGHIGPDRRLMKNKKPSYMQQLIFGLVGILVVISGILVYNQSMKYRLWNNKSAIDVNDDSITTGELNYYIASAKSYFNFYEAKYIQAGYDLWSSKYDDEHTIEQYIRSVSIDTSIRDFILASEAKKIGVSLTPEEIETYKEEQASAYEQLSETDKKRYHVDHKTLDTIYERKALADKYYNQIIEDANLDFDDLCKDIQLSDYQQYDYEYIQYPFGDSEDTDVNSYISDEEKANAYDLMNEVHRSLTEHSDFKASAAERLTLTYDEGSALIGSKSLSEELEQALVELKINEFSSVIETKQGLYIIRKTKDTSKIAYADAKNSTVEAAKEEAFQAVYSTFVDHYKITQYTNVINTIAIGN